MLTTKINTQVISVAYHSKWMVDSHVIIVQQKRLHTVLHAMEDHRRRQSQIFKFETPDSTVSLLRHGKTGPILMNLTKLTLVS